MRVRTVLRERWARVSAMSWDELCMRTRQEVNKRWDAALYRLRGPFSGESPECPAGTPARFFFTSNELSQLVGLLREKLPQEADQIVQQAQRICQHKFDLLGYQDLDYGREIDWHLDIVHGKRARRKPWFQIRLLDFNEVGDAKIIWELNRHQHMVTLAKAYSLTREERFAGELLRQWYHWQQENPYPIGINWASSLEVAFRSLSWLWVRHLLAESRVVPKSFLFDLRRALALNARHIERYLSTYFSPNTHLLGEGVGLFFIGTLCPQLLGASRWRERGWEIVLREAEHQVQTDGMHFEQSTYYHVYALDLFLHARLLAVRNQTSIPGSFDRTLEKMLDVLRVLGQAGTPPRFGDDDGGRVFDPRRNRAEHLLDALSTGAVLFGRGDFKAVAGGLREETLWLLGPESVTRFEGIPSTLPSQASVRFEPSGVHVMASAEPAPQQIVIDAGPQGTGRAGHGHADALSLHLTLNGREWLGDPGTFVYVSSDSERDLFRGTAGHNTLQVDGCPQAELGQPFGWCSLPSVRAEHWADGKTFTLFAGSHAGYCRLPQPVVHRRWVFYLKSRFWLVRDLALGEGKHELQLFWHVAPARFRLHTAGNATLVSDRDQQGLAVLPMEDHGWSQEVRQGWWSPAYGRKEPCPVIRFSAKASLPTEFATLLLPVGGEFQEPGKLSWMKSEDKKANVRGYRYSTGPECHYMFFADCDERWQLGPWASDAQFVYCGVAPREGRQHLVLYQGSYLEFEGRRMIAFRHPVEQGEWLNARGAAQMFCSDKGAFDFLREEVLAEAELVLAD